jgi:nucleoside-diphosphate-sugar epimerase
MERVLVTGGTGLIGGNVCRILRERGTEVRALVRNPAEASELAALGVELATGDITAPDTVRPAMDGCGSVVHAAAVLGGTGQDMETFRRINALGTASVFDAAAERGLRVVFTASLVIFDETRTLTEHSEVDYTLHDPYTASKREAFLDARERSGRGEDVVVVLPGATHGPAPIVSKAMAATSFNRLLRGAINGRLPGYPSGIAMLWSYAPDVASAIVAALDSGESGSTYLAFGTQEDDAIAGVDFFNLACEIAGTRHRVQGLDLDPADPATAAVYGESMTRAISLRRPRPAFDGTLTRQTLGYRPTPVREALAATVDWLRANGQIP